VQQPFVDDCEHQLGPAERRETASSDTLAPGQVEEAVAELALHPRPAKVQAAVASRHDVHIEIPTRFGRVAPHEADDLALVLHSDVDVVVDRFRDAGEPDAARAGQIVAADSERDGGPGQPSSCVDATGHQRKR